MLDEIVNRSHVKVPDNFQVKAPEPQQQMQLAARIWRASSSGGTGSAAKAKPEAALVSSSILQIGPIGHIGPIGLITCV